MPFSARIQILTGYAGLARSLGLSPERLARSAGVNLSLLHELDARISAKAFADLLERSAEVARAEDFGLRLAESREVGILGPIGIVICQESDLGSAIHLLSRYMPFHNESLSLRLKEERDSADLHLEVHTSGRQVIELSIGTFFRILRRLAGPQWTPYGICFEHQAPRSLQRHQKFFGCPIHFGAEFNGILLRISDLKIPIALSDVMLAKYAQRYLESTMLPTTVSFEDKTRELIRLLLPTGGCSADRVAHGLGVNRRTVNRHLAAAGQTFSSVLSDVRIELVSGMLANQKTFPEIADRLGFLSAAAFSRWFKQKFECSPSNWPKVTTQQSDVVKCESNSCA